MKRLLPAPLLSATLFVLWLVLNDSVSPGHLLLAALVAVLIARLTAPLRPVPVRLFHPATLMRFLAVVAHDVVASNFDVARGVWASRPPNGAFVRVPLELRDPNGLAALAMVMCVIPGTVWCELAHDRSALLVHVFDLRDEALLVARIKQRYEQPLMEIFQ
ncbi:MAG: Na+/H+ antiporter subunit E [Methylibium sp.]|uniref:Na+/H+ antiporter subunit E n=1 Tax=Methylibium sp. TaxID=2067992 RepID=UPI00178FEBAE|nr:Na+/H+ antiporter subunit E [Methylibium sp.]MBA3598702.1 Na+/H+ antiporter subunit E [Methylibium sp.]